MTKKNYIVEKCNHITHTNSIAILFYFLELWYVQPITNSLISSFVKFFFLMPTMISTNIIKGMMCVGKLFFILF